MPPKQTRKKTASKSPEKPVKAAPKEQKTEKKEPKKKKEEETYVVEAILDKAKMKGLFRYKVKWLGYPEEESTWEPMKNLESVREMVNEFNAARKKEEDAEKEEDEEEEGKKKDLAKMSGGKEDKEDEEEEEEKAEEKSKSKGKRKSSSQTPIKKAEPKSRSTKNTRRRNIEKEPLAPGEAPVKKLKSDKTLPPVTFGHFEFEDVPEKITKVVKDSDTIKFTIKWNPRPDGFTPNPTEMTNLELRTYNKDLLLDFYEQRLKFVNASHHKNQAMKSPEHKDFGRILDKPTSPISIDDAPEVEEPVSQKIDFVEEEAKKPQSIEEEVLEDIEGKKPERMEEEKVEEPKQSDVVEIEEEKVVPEENKITEENVIPEEKVVVVNEEKETEHKEPEPIEIEEETAAAEPVASGEPIEEETAESKEVEAVNVDAEPVEEAEEEVFEKVEITERIIETQDSKIQETQILITQEVLSNPIETAGSPAKSDSSTPNLFNYDPNL